MLEFITAKLGVSAVQWSIGGITGLGMAWALKRIPNRKLKAHFGLFMYRLGIASTLGMSRIKIIRPFWNHIEKWIIDAIDNIVGHGIKEYIRGLRSDN
mgnify:CR=1 FL=1|jgi:hypothetical protein|tara:strand:+ start:335 stop:628 length:294 start_codon:yes stop_codon:yes gene_type:complete